MSDTLAHPNAAPPRWIKPYGDTLDDGRVQLSFTLPTPLDDNSKEAARQLALQMGLNEPAVVHSEAMGPDFSFYVVYGQCQHRVDLSRIKVAKPEFEVLDKDAINHKIATLMGRKMVVVGACIETDAHTVGIDAIMNMKGYNGQGLGELPRDACHQHGRTSRFRRTGIQSHRRARRRDPRVASGHAKKHPPG